VTWQKALRHHHLRGVVILDDAVLVAPGQLRWKPAEAPRHRRRRSWLQRRKVATADRRRLDGRRAASGRRQRRLVAAKDGADRRVEGALDCGEDAACADGDEVVLVLVVAAALATSAALCLRAALGARSVLWIIGGCRVRVGDAVAARLVGVGAR